MYLFIKTEIKLDDYYRPNRNEKVIYVDYIEERYHPELNDGKHSYLTIDCEFQDTGVKHTIYVIHLKKYDENLYGEPCVNKFVRQEKRKIKLSKINKIQLV